MVLERIIYHTCFSLALYFANIKYDKFQKFKIFNLKNKTLCLEESIMVSPDEIQSKSLLILLRIVLGQYFSNILIKLFLRYIKFMFVLCHKSVPRDFFKIIKLLILTFKISHFNAFFMMSSG